MTKTIAAIVMASGSSRRFGRNKLLADLEGMPVFMHVFDALPQELFSRIVVVSGCAQVLEEGRRRGFVPVLNDDPDAGPARTIRLGLSAIGMPDACMFCVCDQPAVQRSSLQRLVAGYTQGVRALSFDGNRGNPVVFPQQLFGELSCLETGSGGSAVLQRHAQLLELCECSCRRELLDVDTPQELQCLADVRNLFFEGMPVADHPGGIPDKWLNVAPFASADTVKLTGVASPAAAQLEKANLVSADLGICQEECPFMQDLVVKFLAGPVPVVGTFTDPAPWLYRIRERLDTMVIRDVSPKAMQTILGRFFRNRKRTSLIATCPES